MTDQVNSEAKTASMDKGGGDKPLPKAAKITKKDWQKVESFLKEELLQRKQSEYRQTHEGIWKEVDRQVHMKPMTKLNRDGTEADMGWHNVVELGELSKASENISADVRRIIFPQTRFWFECHADIEDQLPLDQTGKRKKSPKLQERVNGRLRSFMSQQHSDFGLKDRVELSIKEALHHGGFVAEVDWDTKEMIYEAVKVKSKSSPIWKPHSMWNCYPDPSPSAISTDIFYEGTMFVESYVPRHKAERMVKSGDDGWMPSQWKKVSKETHVVNSEKLKDVKLTTYWGDINIERSDEDLYYPNHKVVLMNGTIVYMAPNKTPYLPIIYRGYERMDVRDPYYLSPIIKMSPWQKLGTMMANKTMDGVELAMEPPIVYDGNDPDFVLNGGPVIEPGAKVSTKGSSSFKTIEVGDVGVAINALQLVLNEMKEKLGRPGRPVGDRATKAEVVKASQDQEVSLVDFIDKMEIALKSFLFMQHAMNLENLTEYSFFSPEMQDPDFILIKKKDLPKAVHFEVVGARGVLGEQERAEKFTQAFAFALGNPLTAGRLDIDEGLIQIFQDGGTKNPERFLLEQGQESAGALKAKLQEVTQQLQKVGGLLQQEKTKTAAKMAKIQSDSQAKQQKLQVEAAQKSEKMRRDFEAKLAQIKADILIEILKHSGERAMHHEKLLNDRIMAAQSEANQTQ